MTPGDFVIVEGLFSLYWEPARALMDTKVFVAADDGVCLARRQQRDVQERSQTLSPSAPSTRRPSGPCTNAIAGPRCGLRIWW